MLNNFDIIKKVLYRNVNTFYVINYVKGKNMNLGNNISSLRKAKGLSQESLAEKLNVSRQTISNWEQGQTSPNPEQLLLLSKVLEKSTDELLGNRMLLEHKKYIPIYLSSVTICISIAFVFSLCANRFRNEEILFIIICSALIRYSIALIINLILKKIR